MDSAAPFPVIPSSPAPPAASMQTDSSPLKPSNKSPSAPTWSHHASPPPAAANSTLEEEDELHDDDTLSGPPLLSQASPGQQQRHVKSHGVGAQAVTESKPPRGIGYGTGVGKSRKSSCVNCHHRKIRCDQQRPCMNCAAKSVTCKYLEEHEQYAHHAPSRPQHKSAPTAMDVLDHNGKPSLRLINSVLPLQADARLDSASTSKSGESPRSMTPDRGEKKKKKHEIRERIIKGFDSDSDDDAPVGEESKPRIRENGKGLDGEPTVLVASEVDELYEDGERNGVDENQKRAVSIDDDISGELLELASAPPKKRKKAAKAFSVLNLAQSQYSAQLLSQRPSKSLPPPLVQQNSQQNTPSAIQSFPPTPGTATPTAPASSSKSSSASDPYSLPLLNLAQSLPSAEMHTILFTTFFADPFLTEGISLLQPQFMDNFNRFMDRRSMRLQRGDATTLALTFIFLASALRILPEETGRLILATQGSGGSTSHIPRTLSRVLMGQPGSALDATSLDQRYLDLALITCQVAEQIDPQTIMLVVFKLILYRFCTMGHRKDKIIIAGSWLSQGIKIAQALGMGKEWEGLPQGDRELRRRVMWSLYVADRQYSFETAFPYTILDAHQGIHLPSCISEVDLYRISPDARDLPPVPVDGPPTPSTALHIHTQLARRITPMLDSFATISAAQVSHEHILRFDQALDNIQDTLPSCFKVPPLTETRYDTSLPFLSVQRLRLHVTLFAYRSGVHRTHLPTYLSPMTPPAVRQVIAHICLSSLRTQRSSKMLDPKLAFRLYNPVTVFENAATLGLILYIDKAIGADVGVERSVEFMSNRQGVTDALELLDMTGMSGGFGASFAKKATIVLRHLVAQVDLPLEAIPVKEHLPQIEGETSPPNGSHNPEVTKPNDSNVATASAPPDQAKDTPPAHISTPTSAGTETQPGSYTQKAAHWLESLLKGGLNMEVLLREAEWTNGWERVISTM
nr:hypothetical protein L204_01248 [Cryptococcus depauperatus CBS 7855]